MLLAHVDGGVDLSATKTTDTMRQHSIINLVGEYRPRTFLPTVLTKGVLLSKDVMQPILFFLLAFATLVTAVPIVVPIEQLRSIFQTDMYLFTKSMHEFPLARDDPDHSLFLDWNSDACSHALDTPLGFDFKPPCHRHDFGYKNYKRQKRFNEESELKIVNNFGKDMHEECARHEGVRGSHCRTMAKTYYFGVRHFGKQYVPTSLKVSIDSGGR